MSSNVPYIPALRFHWLTPLFDPVLRYLMQETRFKKALVQAAEILPDQKVLDLGCGTATLSILIKQSYPDVDVTGLDIDPAVLQIGRSKAEKVGVRLTLDKGSAYDLPYQNHSFDRVVSSLLFHHLTTQNKQKTMKEVYRVLRPGGSFWIVDFGRPQGPWARLISPIMARLEEASDNHKGQLLAMLSLAGFSEPTSPVRCATIFGTLYLYSGHKAEME